MVADEARRHGNQTTLPRGGWEAYKKRRSAGPRPLNSYTQSQQEAFTAGVDWVIAQQLAWADLTVTDAIWELRRGNLSIFYPLFQENGINPQIGVDCPSDRVHPAGLIQPTNRDGFCLTCGFDHMAAATVLEGDN
ncbi:hypothetical protein F6X37_32470 [Paraburkholderia sp. 31.1]|uniref:hypothetical protein n=1 Tax=Paraburkholderia sp. 31.1 TaxID=2615205 RepID=UPI00165649EA|nr:hypothetical protein [Paraburkholderia sp. 31.1]MBC8726084.1 hypothetical protein [Paraburkholderia sp. 31.1]